VFRGLFEILLAYRRSREIWLPEQAGLGQDRRVFQRVMVRMPCQMSSPLFGLEAACQTIDLSLDGLGLKAPVNWAEGNHVRLELNDAGFAAEGTIAYRREDPPQFRYGVKFKNLGWLQIMHLRRFLKQNHRGR
jgi:hypothetical protein